MNIAEAYRQFFIKSAEGQEFVKTLEGMIDTAHENAEKNAEKSRDFTQEARGVRSVLEIIQSHTAETKKGRRKTV